MRKCALFLLIFLSSCKVGPNYHAPIIQLPQEFKEPIHLGKWWEQFDDPLLNQLIEEGIKGNFDLKMAFQRINYAREVYRITDTSLLPSIDIDGLFNRERISQTLSDSPFLGSMFQNIWNFRFDASWELDFFGRIQRKREAEYADYEATQEAFNDISLIVISEISKTYNDIRVNEALLESTENLVNAYKTRMELSFDRMEAGLDSDLDVKEMVALFRETQARIYPLEMLIKKLNMTLSILLGRSIHLETKGPLLNGYGKTNIYLPSDLLRRRPDVREAERYLAAATARIGEKKAELFPIFSLTSVWGFLTSQTPNIFNVNSQAWRFGPEFRWPFVDFGRIRSEMKAQTAKEQEALAQYEKTVLSSIKDAETSLFSYKEEEIRYQDKQAALNAKQQALTYTEEKWEAGLISYAESLNETINYYETEIQTLSAQGELFTRLITLYKSLGGEWTCSSSP
ncbi:MAG: efflux transporter outer membrane subunit [Simkaniaceae bacterium]|nr:efflux transporter outer membrane subunit [Simkaniaceae bacterium]